MEFKPLERSAHRAEAIAYWAAVLLHLWPVWGNAWFVTLDGPCHVYNSRLILDLLEGNGVVGEYFRFNPFPEPNWLGHAIMALVMTVASPRIAEKVVFTLIIVGMGWAFRRLAVAVAPQRRWLAWLALPFLLTNTLRMGFINFSLGLPLLLLATERFERVVAGEDRRASVHLGLLMLALYFAHITTFLATFGVLVLRTWAHYQAGGRGQVPRIARPLLLATAVPLMLTTAFLLSHRTGAEATRSLPMVELWTWLINGQAWVTLTAEEALYARPVMVCITTLFMLALAGLRWPVRVENARQWSYAVAALGMLVAFLLLPDKLASGGVLSPRLLLFAMLLCAVCALTSTKWKWLTLLCVVVITASDLLHLRQQSATAEALSNEAQEFLTIANGLEPDAVVLPLNYGDNWMHSNFSEYAGAVSGAVVLDNIGAASPHFPLAWRPERSPHPSLGSFSTSDRPCTVIDAYGGDQGAWVTHVLTWKLSDTMTDSCTMEVRRQLAAGFEQVASSPSGDARLYRRRVR